MIETIQSELALLLLLTPLGLIGVWRWSVYLFKSYAASKYRPVPDNGAHDPSEVTFVVPVYNEDPAIFLRALESWINERPAAIVLVIDHSDTACIEVAREIRAISKVPVVPRITHRSGKREALIDGIRMVNTPFVTLIDSDTIFEPGVVPHLLAPFADPRIGGSAPRQKVLEPKTIVQRVYNIQLEERYDVEMPFLDRGGLTTTCISGRTGMYRTDAVRERLSDLEFEYFWGTRCVSGDDKCLTRIIQRDGWKVKYQSTALVWTHAAPDVKTYLKQRTRWTRNTWRSDLKAIFDDRRWIWQNRYLAFHSIDRFIQPFTLILGPIFLFTALIAGFFGAAVLFLCWVLVTRLLKILPHLSREPRSLLILPFYIVFTYVIALIKIYALFTVWKQGWMTRWSKGRLAATNFARLLYGRVAPITATALVVAILAQGMNVYYDEAISFAMANESYKPRTVALAEVEAEAATLEDSIRNPSGSVTHVVRGSETAELIAARYNVPLRDLELPAVVQPGATINVPIASLRTPNDVETLRDRPTSTLIVERFSPNSPRRGLNRIASENIIYVTGAGTAISIGQLVRELQREYGEEFVVDEGGGVWYVRSSIAVERDATLYFDGEEVRWLKMHSSNDYFTWLASFDATIHIEKSKITSWDPAKNAVDSDIERDGRTFILAKNSGRMDVIDSELSHLGYLKYGDNERGNPFGGVYGLSWKIEAGTLDEKILTGNLINSRVHHNLFGVYTFGSVGQVMRDNHVYENVRYGFDPHDDSNHLIIEDNYAYDNGSHGIITSKRCFNNLFVNNKSFNNALHGIMLDQASDANVVRNNELYGNTDGVVALDSRDNFVHSNLIYDNRKAGVRLNTMSSENYVFRNEIRNNDKGAYVYDGSIDNHFIENVFTDNRIAVHVRNATYNVFERNSSVGNDTTVQVSEQSIRNYVVFNE